jgi:hypothetical protein
MSETKDIQDIVIESYQRKLKIETLERQVELLQAATAVRPGDGQVTMHRDALSDVLTLGLAARVDIRPQDLEGPNAREAVRVVMDKLVGACAQQIMNAIQANRMPRRGP